MTGSFKVSLPLHEGKRYYVSGKASNPDFGGDYFLFLEPLEGTDGSRFFYVRFSENKMVEISGEGYIIPPNALSKRKEEACKNYDASNIRYLILKEDGTITETKEYVSQADYNRYMQCKGEN